MIDDVTAPVLLLVSLMFLPLGPLTMDLYYRKCHVWRELKEDRQRSAWFSAWCGCGALGDEIAEEIDATEDICKDILDVCNSPVDDTNVTKVSKSMKNITMIEIRSDMRYYTI